CLQAQSKSLGKSGQPSLAQRFDVQRSATQFGYARQFRGSFGTFENHAPMLQDGVSMTSLGAAGDFPIADQHVTLGSPLKTEEWLRRTIIACRIVRPPLRDNYNLSQRLDQRMGGAIIKPIS